jgi:hypothetical protein
MISGRRQAAAVSDDALKTIVPVLQAAVAAGAAPADPRSEISRLMGAAE